MKIYMYIYTFLVKIDKYTQSDATQIELLTERTVQFWEDVRKDYWPQSSLNVSHCMGKLFELEDFDDVDVDDLLFGKNFDGRRSRIE